MRVEINWRELGVVLRAAKCPECDGSGAYYGGGGDEFSGPEVVQCQWCDVSKRLISEIESIVSNPNAADGEAVPNPNK